MMQRVFVALLTIAVFAAGYAVRAWTERKHPMPAPPPALANEFAQAAQRPDNNEKREVDRAKLVAEIEKLRPQIEVYRTQVDEIYAEFDREFLALLNPKQREKRESDMKRRAEKEARKRADPKPLSDDELTHMRERPLTDVYWMVTVTPALERFTKHYDLDAQQQTATRALLSLRRNKFIALLDGTPHPSIKLSQLAPLIERVAEQPKEAK